MQRGASGYYQSDGVALPEGRRRRTTAPANYAANYVASMEERGRELPLGDEFSANQLLMTPPLSLPGQTTRQRRSRQGNYNHIESTAIESLDIVWSYQTYNQYITIKLVGLLVICHPYDLYMTTHQLT